MKEPIEYISLKELLLSDKTGFIPMPRQLSLVLGFNPTGLLEELYDRYDYYKSQELLNACGEFFYTINDVELKTGLSKKEQSTSIKKLKEYNFIKYTINRGMPPKRYFLMNPNLEGILKNIYKESDEKKDVISERNKSEMERLLGI